MYEAATQNNLCLCGRHGRQKYSIACCFAAIGAGQLVQTLKLFVFGVLLRSGHRGRAVSVLAHRLVNRSHACVKQLLLFFFVSSCCVARGRADVLLSHEFWEWNSCMYEAATQNNVCLCSHHGRQTCSIACCIAAIGAGQLVQYLRLFVVGVLLRSGHRRRIEVMHV